MTVSVVQKYLKHLHFYLRRNKIFFKQLQLADSVKTLLCSTYMALITNMWRLQYIFKSNQDQHSIKFASRQNAINISTVLTSASCELMITSSSPTLQGLPTLLNSNQANLEQCDSRNELIQAYPYTCNNDLTGIPVTYHQGTVEIVISLFHFLQLQNVQTGC